MVESLRTSRQFILDPHHRREAMRSLVSSVACRDTFVVIHPPATAWRAADEAARFCLPSARRKDLALCVRFGTLGFAQLCDDRLQQPVPLLVAPAIAEGDLLEPRNLPCKSFSQRLCVERVGPRRLILFDTAGAIC